MIDVGLKKKENLKKVDVRQEHMPKYRLSNSSKKNKSDSSNRDKTHYRIRKEVSIIVKYLTFFITYF